MSFWPRRKGRRHDEEGGLHEMAVPAPSRRKTEKNNDSEDIVRPRLNIALNLGDYESSQAQADGWQEARNRFKKLDDFSMREYNEDIDTVLVFAGLFSAILTAFIVEGQKKLEDDPITTSVQVLQRISMQLNGSFNDQSSPPERFSPSTTIVTVNALWFCGLILSLFAALLGILAKQWLHVYGNWSERDQPRNSVILRYVYQEGFLRWHVPEIIGLLPVLLQIALLLFAVGLVAYMWTLNPTIASILSALVAMMILVVIVTIVLPFFSEDCPYKSPIGLIIAALKAKYFDGLRAQDLTSWQRYDSSKAKLQLDSTLADDIVAQSGLMLDLAPRADLESALEKPITDGSLLGSRISALPEAMLRLMFKLILDATRKMQLEADEDVRRALHAIHLLDYVSRESEGDARRIAAHSVIHIYTSFGDRLEMGLPIILDLVRRSARQEHSFITEIPWRCAALIHSWGLVNDPESDDTALICLYTLGITANNLGLSSKSEIQSSIKDGTYDSVLNALQFWIEKALRKENLYVVAKIGEKQFQRLFERHRVYLTSFSSFGRTWDLPTDENVTILTGHTNFVESVAFSPSGSHIASSSADQTVRLWDMQTWEITTELGDHSGWVYSVAFSPDGSYIAFGSSNSIAYVWDLRTGTRSAVLIGHTHNVLSVAFSPDGAYIATSSRDKTVRIWNTQTGANIAILEGHTDNVWSVAFSPDASCVVSGSQDHTMRLWKSPTGEHIAVLSEQMDQVYAVTFSPDGSRIACGSFDTNVYIWDSRAEAIIHVLRGHSNTVRSVTFSSDGSLLLSGSFDHSVRLWDSQTGASIAVLKGHTDLVISVAFSPDGSRIASGSQDNTARVYALRSYDSVRRPRTHPGPVAFVEFSSDGSQVISYDMEGASRTWNATSSQLYPTVPTSIKLDPTSFRVEAGWLLYRRPQDDFSRRLLRLIAHFEPSSQIVTFGHSLAYGTRAGETVRIDLSDDLLL